MPKMTIDIAQIADLDTRIGVPGSIGAGERAGDDLFEYLISIAVLIYEMYP